MSQGRGEWWVHAAVHDTVTVALSSWDASALVRVLPVTSLTTSMNTCHKLARLVL
jgi:hypothetical protein